MIFTQPIFLFFFLVCFLVHWSLPGHRAQKNWLLACSYFFYGYWDWRFLFLIAVSTGIDFAAGRSLHASQDPRLRRLIVTLSLCSNLGILGFSQYFNFFVVPGAQLASLLGISLDPTTLETNLPVGRRFGTVRSTRYTLDLYRGQLQPVRSLRDFALYVSFFPQLVAGPIVRARGFLPQLVQPPIFAEVEARKYLLLFLAGFFKKACLADQIAAVIDPVFTGPENFGSLDLALSSLLYSVQIYCDFSGYSDMAIAVAGLLGYRLVKNFDFPYLSQNIQVFWQRWHISLSTWLRDYLYIPLGGSRHGESKTLRNLMITMLLGGLWHGANMTFVVWGALHGAALVVHRYFMKWRGSEKPPAATEGGALARGIALAATLVTFIWVTFCFTVFRSPSIGAARDYFANLIKSTESSHLNLDWWLLLILLGGTHFVFSRYARGLGEWVRGISDLRFYFAYGAAWAIMVAFIPRHSAPFIYFQF